MIRAGRIPFLCAALFTLNACTGEVGGRPYDGRTFVLNGYSWDGSWNPKDDDFPLSGLLDNEYSDNHLINNEATPVLPPGRWDWDDANDDLANWERFQEKIGGFDPLRDREGRHFGWSLRGNDPEAIEFTGSAAYFEGSAGTDILDLGPEGALYQFGQGDLGDGPDVLSFNESWSLDFRTGSSPKAGDGSRDNDLVIAGCKDGDDSSFKIETTTIHTGPGRDLVFARDIERSGIDLGNGKGGRTDALDPADGDDIAVLRGNTYDARVYGGNGDDLVAWYVDENVQSHPWLGLNFFGGGGYGKALWSDSGTDRLILVIPTETRIVTTTPTLPGALLVRLSSGEFIPDGPTANDPNGTYCIECGVSPGGRKTMILEYESADESIHTGYFYVTAFEELQIGVGHGARVYRINDVTGAATRADDLQPVEPPVPIGGFCR